jgi:cell division septation protein DedD
VGDLMAVLRNGTTAVLLTSPTCKASPCATSGNVSISQSRAVGVYKADLLRSNKATVVAVSTTFRLQHTCGPTTAPSKHPTKHPTKKPTKQPTRKPTKKPTKQPTAAPTASPTAFTVNEAAHSIFTQASDVIAGMVQANSRFTPLFLRLGFHDCVHVCDGTSIECFSNEMIAILF